jgi:hypothetical protein
MESRDERVERYYNESAWDLATWLVDTEDANAELHRAASDLADHADETCSVLPERDRYRLAWLSARRRDGVNSMNALEVIDRQAEEIARLKAELSTVRKSTCAPAEAVG